MSDLDRQLIEYLLVPGLIAIVLWVLLWTYGPAIERRLIRWWKRKRK